MRMKARSVYPSHALRRTHAANPGASSATCAASPAGSSQTTHRKAGAKHESGVGRIGPLANRISRAHGALVLT